MKNKGAWTEEEDGLLAYWQSQYGNRWAEVAKHIPGKSGQQCAQRWRHRVNPNISREKWTEAEDKKLAALVKKHGHSWAEIARKLPGRTDQQCMGRWRRHVDPSLRKEGWTQEEDDALAELVEEYGTAWSDISKLLGTRSSHQCRLRWCQLSGAEQPSSRPSARSGGSKSRSGAASKSAVSSSDSAQLAKQLDFPDAAAAAAAAIARRQSTAGKPAGEGDEPWAEGDEGTLPATLLSPNAGRRPRSTRPAARRLSTVSEVGMTEELSEDDSLDDSPPFTLRRTTARTAARPAHGGEEGTAAAGGPVADAADFAAGAAAAAAAWEHHTAAAAVRQSSQAGTAPAAPVAATAAVSGGRAASGSLSFGGGGGSSFGVEGMEVCGSERQPSQSQLAAPQQAEQAAQEQAGAGPLAPSAAAAELRAEPAASNVAAAAAAAVAAVAAAAAAEAAVGLPPELTPGSSGRAPTVQASGGYGPALSGPALPGAGAGAAGQPSVAPRRPRGRPRLYIRPLELPPAAEAAPAAAASSPQQQQQQLTPPAAPLEEDEESPALTHGLAPSLDLLSPSRTLSHAPIPAHPPLFTPPSSVRKRALPPSRMAAFGPRPPPLAIAEPAGGTPDEQQQPPQQQGPSPGDVTPMRVTGRSCGGGEEDGVGQLWGLTPNVVTLLQSPTPGMCGGGMDPLISPQFGGLLTPEWAKGDRSQLPASDSWTGRRSGGGGSGGRGGGAGGGQRGPGPATSLDFTLLGTSPKKAKTEQAGPPSSALPASASWLSLATAAVAGGRGGDPAATATAAHLLLPESVGRTALAAALQQGLGLDSTAKTGLAAVGGLHGATLTSMKPPTAAGQQAAAQDGAAPLTSASVRVQLRTLLENL